MKRATKDASEIRRRTFALAYAKDPNGLAALRAAGYSPTTKNQARLLKDPQVQEVLAQQAMRVEAATGISVADVVNDLDELRQVDIGDVFEDDGEGQPRMREWKSLSRGARRSISKVKVTRRTRRTGTDEDGMPTTEDETVTEVTLVDRLEVLQKIGNHLGAWKASEKPPEPGNTYVIVVPEPMKTVEEWSQQLPARK